MNLRQAISAVVFKDDKFFMVSGKDWPKGAWCFPQGGVNEKETHIDAVKRELKEELGTEKFVQEFNSLVDEIFQVRKEGQKNNYEDELTSNLKYVLDNMDQDVSKKILNKIFSEYFDEEEEFSKIAIPSETGVKQNFFFNI